jgi:hypothetical protein
MLENTQIELGVTTAYQDYLSRDGHFAFPEYQIINDALENGIYCPECPQKGGQILYTASLCDLEVTETEVAIYTILREKIGRYLGETSIEDGRAKSACCMGDTELIAEIFLLTDKTGEKYHAVIEKFPNIFKKTSHPFEQL